MSSKVKGKSGRPTKGRSVQSNGLLNYEEAAQFLGVATKTLQAWCERSTYNVPHIRLGRLIRFRPSSLARWLESRERHPVMTAPATEAQPGSMEA
jgi:excisionase family DNA binding protein